MSLPVGGAGAVADGSAGGPPAGAHGRGSGDQPAIGDRVPAPLLFVGSGFIQYTGAAAAVALFATVSPGGVTWWRLTVGALFLLIMWRPWRAHWTRSELAATVLFGLVLGAMNLLFYEAIARIPLGAAVSIEFVGPVAVAAIKGSGWSSRAAAALALLGVGMIGGLGIDISQPAARTGALFALGAAVMWAGYIVLGQRIASQRSGANSLAVGCAAAALISAPLLAPAAFQLSFTWPAVATVLAMALFSTAIPYSLEAVAMRRLTPGVFALLTALLPATSTIVGAVALQQIPTPSELVGLAAVSAAIWLAGRRT